MDVAICFFFFCFLKNVTELSTRPSRQKIKVTSKRALLIFILLHFQRHCSIMNNQLRLVIYKRKYVYDDLIASPKSICEYKNTFCNDDDSCNKQKFHPLFLRKKGFNAYLISLYIYVMQRSNVYRKSAFNTLKNFIRVKFKQIYEHDFIIFIKLRSPKYQYLDYVWNEKLTRMVMERQEIDHAMSWLSTLGGAFSALGDYSDHCAKVAGQISVEQFKLSMRLGDPQLVARCKLYAALSLLQQNYFKVSRRMIKEIFEFAVNEKDVRLQRMCQGVWAKLQYLYHQKRKKLRNGIR